MCLCDITSETNKKPTKHTFVCDERESHISINTEADGRWVSLYKPVLYFLSALRSNNKTLFVTPEETQQSPKTPNLSGWVLGELCLNEWCMRLIFMNLKLGVFCSVSLVVLGLLKWGKMRRRHGVELEIEGLHHLPLKCDQLFNESQTLTLCGWYKAGAGTLLA